MSSTSAQGRSAPGCACSEARRPVVSRALISPFFHPCRSLAQVNKDLASDPTLPHTTADDNIICKKCNSVDAVYFQAQSNRDKVWCDACGRRRWPFSGRGMRVGLFVSPPLFLVPSLTCGCTTSAASAATTGPSRGCSSCRAAAVCFKRKSNAGLATAGRGPRAHTVQQRALRGCCRRGDRDELSLHCASQELHLSLRRSTRDSVVVSVLNSCLLSRLSLSPSLLQPSFPRPLPPFPQWRSGPSCAWRPSPLSPRRRRPAFPPTSTCRPPTKRCGRKAAEACDPRLRALERGEGRRRTQGRIQRRTRETEEEERGKKKKRRKTVRNEKGEAPASFPAARRRVSRCV